jgi:hypothetical protein
MTHSGYYSALLLAFCGFAARDWRDGFRLVNIEKVAAGTPVEVGEIWT